MLAFEGAESEISDRPARKRVKPPRFRCDTDQINPSLCQNVQLSPNQVCFSQQSSVQNELTITRAKHSRRKNKNYDKLIKSLLQSNSIHALHNVQKSSERLDSSENAQHSENAYIPRQSKTEYGLPEHIIDADEEAGQVSQQPRERRGRKKIYEKLILDTMKASKECLDTGVEIDSILTSIKMSLLLANRQTLASKIIDLEMSDASTSLVNSAPTYESVVPFFSTNLAVHHSKSNCSELTVSRLAQTDQMQDKESVPITRLKELEDNFPKMLTHTPETVAYSKTACITNTTGQVTNIGKLSKHTNCLEVKTFTRIRRKRFPNNCLMDCVSEHDDSDWNICNRNASGKIKRKSKSFTKWNAAQNIKPASNANIGQIQMIDAENIMSGDQFFVPQTPVLADYKMNPMMVGPFQVLGSGNSATLHFVPQEKRQLKTPKILKGDLILPSGSVKGLTVPADSPPLLILQQPVKLAVVEKANIATLDHDYASFNKHASAEPKKLKTLIKPISMTQHILARVEKVVEREGSSLVTISGEKRKHGPAADMQRLEIVLLKDGIPVVQSLEDVMTETLIRVEKLRQNYHLALKAEPTPLVYRNISEVPVIEEILLDPDGQVCSKGDRPGLSRGRPKKLNSIIYHLASASTLPRCETNNLNESRYDEEEIWIEDEVIRTDDLNHVETSLAKENLLREGLIGNGFQPREITVTGDDKFPAPAQDENPKDRSQNVKELQIDASFYPVRVCQFCLRIFPATYLLFNHVKSCHGEYSEDVGYLHYLQELQNDAKIICPYCPGARHFSNEYKFHTHLVQFHTTEAEAVGLDCSSISDYVTGSLKQVSDEKQFANQCPYYSSKTTTTTRPVQHQHNVSDSQKKSSDKDETGWPRCTVCGKWFKTVGILCRHVAAKHHSSDGEESTDVLIYLLITLPFYSY